ncbi:predicted protein [Streptomyces viridosporus ATCC 14672]|uniref:Predicted protein n=1 Tax=Streptomyces viridosporus (strain ATCC 14672 / DSM 40746 / JCM 4963 / KCTC 9882 / NRRL B-12104 / FH 1290) TaxID=566461 RepID=D6A7P6_STRV1|nr:predicted protein [Streptomyces viridosporus ATCC 14672]
MSVSTVTKYRPTHELDDSPTDTLVFAVTTPSSAIGKSRQAADLVRAGLGHVRVSPMRQVSLPRHTHNQASCIRHPAYATFNHDHSPWKCRQFSCR